MHMHVCICTYAHVGDESYTPGDGLSPERSPDHFFQEMCRIEVGIQWHSFQVPRMPGRESKWGWKFGGHISFYPFNLISKT